MLQFMDLILPLKISCKAKTRETNANFLLLPVLCIVI